MKDLNDLRIEIDKADSEMLNLLAKRLSLVHQVGEYKKANNLPPLQPQRWQQVLEKLKLDAKKLNLNQQLVEDIWNLVHEHALRLEEGVIAEDQTQTS